MTSLYIIYTESDILLSKNPYSSWREIQDEYPSYKVSLGPWKPAEVSEYLASDYPELMPSAVEQVSDFIVSKSKTKVVTFAVCRTG